MSRNGSGGFSLLSNSWNPAVSGVTATTADWQALINDIAAAIQQSISADGQTPITGNLQMGGNKLTNLAAGSGTGQSLRFEQLFSQGTLTDIASAATLDIGGQLSNFLRVTGTTGVTSFGTNYNGPRFLIFAGAVLLTHSATLVLPTAANITTAAGDSLIAIPISGGWQVVAYQKATGAPIGAAASGANTDITSLSGLTTPISLIALRSYLSGCTMSTAGASTTISIAAGAAMNSTNAYLMQLAATSKTTSAWAVGSAVGGLDTGTIANSTWYYFYAIRRPDTGVVDVVFSLSSSSPTLPANYTQFRYIGAGLTNGSGQWTKFTQAGDDFYWDTPVLDFSGAGTTTASTLTISVPRGRKVKSALSMFVSVNTVYVSDLANADLVPSQTVAPLGTLISDGAAGQITGISGLSIWTNTSAQIRHRSTNTNTWRLVTLGWTDLRGKDL